MNNQPCRVPGPIGSHPVLLVLLAAGMVLSSLRGQQQAVSLDGFEDFIDVPHSPAVAVSGSMTIEAWIWIDAYPANPAMIVTKKRRQPWAGFTFHLQNGYLQYGFSTSTAGSVWYSAEIPWNVVLPGQWTHVAGVTDGSAVQLLVNGVVQHASTASAPLVGSDSNPLRIGLDCEWPQYNAGTEFAGLIDEVRYWSVARTAAEIQAAMFQELDNLPGLVASWHLDGDVLDLTGGQNGVLAGNAAFVTSTAPVTCPGATICYTLNTPVSLGTPAKFQVTTSIAGAPIFTLVDVATGAVPLGVYGTSQIAISPVMVALADPTGIFGPGFSIPATDLSGTWALSITAPSDPGLLALTLFTESYVVDLTAVNGLFHQSNLVTIAFQP